MGTTSPIVIHGLGGNDAIVASGLSAPGMQFILDGGDGNDVLHGGQGNDVLMGGAGSDRFEFSGINGTDTIADFQHGLDQIRITGYGAALDNFSDLAGRMAQVGADVHIDLEQKCRRGWDDRPSEHPVGGNRRIGLRVLIALGSTMTPVVIPAKSLPSRKRRPEPRLQGNRVKGDLFGFSCHCWGGRPHGIACQTWGCDNQDRSRP